MPCPNRKEQISIITQSQKLRQKSQSIISAISLNLFLSQQSLIFSLNPVLPKNKITKAVIKATIII